LSFSLRIITRTGDARGGASGFAELLEKHADEVRNTKSLLECIQNEPSLRSPNVQDTVITIQEAAQSLHAFLAAQKATLEKGGVQKYLRQLFKNSQDLERLDEIMNHLARAKIDLGAKIQVINAGLMGSLRGGVRSNTDALKALNGRVKELLGEDHVLRVAAHDGGPSGVGESSAYCRIKREKGSKLTLAKSAASWPSDTAT
jgi:flagellar hook-basal body complex protein FliE